MSKRSKIFRSSNGSDPAMGAPGESIPVLAMGWLLVAAATLGLIGFTIANRSETYDRLAIARRMESAASPSIAGEASRPLVLREDDAPLHVLSELRKGSHVKIFLPSLPHLYTSHSINGALIKPSDSPRGWEYDMATSHSQMDPKTFEFTLRKGVRFQDGTPFNADSVVMNMESFRKSPYRYTKIDQVFDRVEKVDDNTVRFHLTEPYGPFLNDLIWMQFYTETYLKTNPGGWNGRNICPNLSMPGRHGLGPYVLTEGYIEGDRQTARAVLKANPYYWDKRYPLVETVTVYTELNAEAAKRMTLEEEGALDISVIPPEDKVETILAPYSKLVISPSTDNIAIHFNLINGHPRLRDRQVRRALNEALHQGNILSFVFENEGRLSPISPDFPGVASIAETLLPVPAGHDPYSKPIRRGLRTTLDGLTLKVLSQDRYRPLWRGIETQLKMVGVTLDIEFTTSEKELFEPLLRTHSGSNQKRWDLLIWGNDDWYYNHPFAAFVVYRTENVWSTCYPDPIMDRLIGEMFRTEVDSVQFPAVCEKIMKRAYDEAYMLFVPTPNKVFAVNKEVVFRPYKTACLPLWKIQVTDQHWSVRQGPYPEDRKRPVKMSRTLAH